MPTVPTVDVLGLPGKLWSKRSTSLLASCYNSKYFTLITVCSISGKTAASDRNGSVFVFDCCSNNWCKLQIANRLPITGLTFLYQGREIGICLSDGKLLIHRLIDSSTQALRISPKCQQVKPAVTHIVTDPYYPDMFCTFSSKKIIIWLSEDTESWKQLRVLSPTSEAEGGHGDFVQVVQQGGNIFVLFSRCIIAWTLPSFEFYFKVDLRRDSENFTCLSVKEGLIVAGGGCCVYVWEVSPDPSLVSVIELPTKRVVRVQLFKNNSKMLVLGDDGRCLLLNNGSDSCTVEIDIGALDCFKRNKVGITLPSFAGFDMDDKGRFISLLHQDMSLISLVDVKALTSSQNCAKRDQPKPGPKPSNTVLRLSDMNMNMNQIKSFLLEHYRFPEKYRHLLWRFMLKLPQNEDMFASYLNKGVHPCFSDIPMRYPLRDSRHLKKFHLILSALSYWSPLCTELEYLPAIVFPFMIFFGCDDLATFETCISFMTKVQRGFLCSFPHPPIPLLATLESIITQQDKDLVINKTEILVYSPRLTLSGIAVCIFSKQLSSLLLIIKGQSFDQDESGTTGIWVACSQIFLHRATAAFLLSQRSKLLKMKNSSQIESWVHETQCGDVKRVISLLHHLRQDHATRSLLVKLSGEIGEDDLIQEEPGQYPTLRGYPEFALDFQQQERERLAAEESTARKKTLIMNEMTKRMKELEVQEKLWQQTQQLSAQMDACRQDEIRKAHDKELDASLGLHAFNQHLRLSHVLEKEIETQKALDRSMKLRKEREKQSEDELRWSQRRAETLNNMKQEEECINKQVARVMSRIHKVEEDLKADEHHRTQQAEVMRQRASMLSAEKGLLMEWELEDVGTRDGELDGFQHHGNKATTAPVNIFDIKEFLRIRHSKIKSASEKREERIRKDIQLSSLLDMDD